MFSVRMHLTILSLLFLTSCGSGSGDVPGNFGSFGASKIFISGNTEITSYTSTDIATGTLAANRTIAGSNTLLDDARGMALDSANDRLYVANFAGNSIAVFDNASTASGDTNPTRVITGSITALESPVSIFLDTTNDRLYVSNFSSSAQNILVFDSVSMIDGNVAPSRVISGFSHDLSSQLSGISVDVARDILYIVDFNGDAIYVIGNASTATGAMAASQVISGNQTLLSSAHGIEIDTANDRIFVSNYGGKSVLVFDNASSATGNLDPTRTITSSEATFNPIATQLDSTNDKLYVLNSTDSSLEVINTASTASGTITPDAMASLDGVFAPAGLVVNTQ